MYELVNVCVRQYAKLNKLPLDVPTLCESVISSYLINVEILTRQSSGSIVVVSTSFPYLSKNPSSIKSISLSVILSLVEIYAEYW